MADATCTRREIRTVDFFSANASSVWNAVYTRPRAEKKVRDRLERKEVAVYLPMKKEERVWSDRRKVVEVPYFRSYLFVNVGDAEVRKVRSTPGVAQIISFRGERAPIPATQIKSIRRVVESEKEITRAPYIQEGERVRVISGPLSGVEGVSLDDSDRNKMRVQVDSIRQALEVSVAPTNLEKMDG